MIFLLYFFGIRKGAACAPRAQPLDPLLNPSIHVIFRGFPLEFRFGYGP